MRHVRGQQGLGPPPPLSSARLSFTPGRGVKARERPSKCNGRDGQSRAAVVRRAGFGRKFVALAPALELISRPRTNPIEGNPSASHKGRRGDRREEAPKKLAEEYGLRCLRPWKGR